MSRRGDREQGGVISIQGGHNNLMLSPTREAPLTGSREAGRPHSKPLTGSRANNNLMLSPTTLHSDILGP